MQEYSALENFWKRYNKVSVVLHVFVICILHKTQAAAIVVVVVWYTGAAGQASTGSREADA